MSEPNEIARLKLLLAGAEARAELAAKSVWSHYEPWLCLAGGLAFGLILGHLL